ncbi:MAG: HDIG domain-containing metalloprotein [Chloroflexia bacterium]
MAAAFSDKVPRWVYRSRQFFAALLGRLTEEETAEARTVLGPGLYQLFAGMPGQYRHHLFQVYRRVREAGCDNPHVWQAALLHDVGKHDPASGKSVSLPYRVAIVLLKAAGPGRRILRKLEDPHWDFGFASNPKSKMGWRYPFYLSRHHAELGARLVEEHGGSADVVWLIAAHHKHSVSNEALTVLRTADEKS